MEKMFRSLVPEFFKRNASSLPGFEHRKISAASMREHSPRPLVLMSAFWGSGEYFFLVGPFGSSPGNLLVEIGWKPSAADSYPAVTVDRVLSATKLNDSSFNWSVETFAIRLSRLCYQSPSEMVWNLFAPEVWVRERETYDEFRQRTSFAAIDAAIEVISSGRFDEQFATNQIELICGDILNCMREAGLPFLAEAAARRGDRSAGS